jgi:hypothetical protein
VGRPQLCWFARHFLSSGPLTFFSGHAPPRHKCEAMKPPISLHHTPDERLTLEAWTSDTATTKRALRASIVLAVADGLDTRTIAEHLRVRPSTASKWLHRFVQERLAGLDDRARSGAPRRISAERIADVVRRTLEPTPCGARHWSCRMMAHTSGMSRSTVHRLWRSLDIAPDRPTPAQ